MSEQPAASDQLIIRSAQDVTRLVNAGLAAFRHPKALVILALGGMFIDAYNFTSIAFGLSDITEQFGLSSVMVGVVSSSIMVGALVGALIGGYLTDKIGRYRVFMADMVILVLATLGSGLAPEAWSLTGFRFILGFGIGMDFPVALAFIAEFSSQSGKGRRVSLWQPVWYTATSATYLVLIPLFYLVPGGHLWRWVVALGAVPSLIVMLLRRKYMDESPSWAAGQGNLQRAAKIISQREGVRAVVAPDADYTPTGRLAISVRGFRKLLQRPYLSRTIQASVVSACQSMEYYAVGFGLPTIIAGLSHASTMTTIVGSLIVNAVFGFTGAVFGVRMVSRWGSWRLATTGFLATMTCLIILGFIGHPSGTVMLIVFGLLLGLFVFFHAYGPGPQGGTQTTLSYPTSLRGVGNGVGNAIDRVGSILSLLLFPVFSAALVEHVYFVVAIAPALGLIPLLIIRWNPTAHDVDSEEFAPTAHGTA